MCEGKLYGTSLVHHCTVFVMVHEKAYNKSTGEGGLGHILIFMSVIYKPKVLSKVGFRKHFLFCCQSIFFLNIIYGKQHNVYA